MACSNNLKTRGEIERHASCISLLTWEQDTVPTTDWRINHDIRRQRST